jgi:homoserine O-acetyltransferase
MPAPTLTIPRFCLEDGTVLQDVPVAYRTWGSLNESADNAVLVCHALTGTPDAADWWGELIGPGRALDPETDFVVCPNVPGSPYGSIAPSPSGPPGASFSAGDFPAFTIRDTVALHRRLLDRLGVNEVACAIGGSMGGMQVLEWAFETTGGGRPYVRSLVPIAVGGRHSAWQIGWSEAQRQAIFADPKWRGGAYPADDPPDDGLAAARMMAMISYRSRDSLDGRFGRGDGDAESGAPFAVQSYLRHHGNALVDRFDAGCYVALTRQMDTHDVSRGRGPYPSVLGSIRQPALVVGIDSDVLYPLAEQEELGAHLPRSTLEVLSSPHGHDAFLIELEALNGLVAAWRSRREPSPASLAA